MIHHPRLRPSVEMTPEGLVNCSWMPALDGAVEEIVVSNVSVDGRLIAQLTVPHLAENPIVRALCIDPSMIAFVADAGRAHHVADDPCGEFAFKPLSRIGMRDGREFVVFGFFVDVLDLWASTRTTVMGQRAP